MFLSFIGTKTLESITRLPKTCILRIFHIVKYQNTIIHVKHSKWEKETTFPETCNSNVYEHVCHQYAKKKKIESTLYGKTKEHYEKDVFWVFLSYLRIKTRKHIQNAFYEYHYKKTYIFSVFKLVT